MHRAIILAFASLLATAAVAQSAPSASSGQKGADSRDKLVCKRFPKTGSLVASYRTCKPESEWERERENIRQLNVTESCRDRANGGSLCSP